MRRAPARIDTRVATPAPPCVTRPVSRLTPLTFRPERVIPPGAIAAGEATVAAVLTVPTPGFHGVQRATHAPCTTGPKTPVRVRSALRNFEPKVAPIGAGRSGGGRQNTSCAEPSAVWAPLVGRTYAGEVDRLPGRLQHEQQRHLRRGAQGALRLRDRCDGARRGDDDVAGEREQGASELERADLRPGDADLRPGCRSGRDGRSVRDHDRRTRGRVVSDGRRRDDPRDVPGRVRHRQLRRRVCRHGDGRDRERGERRERDDGRACPLSHRVFSPLRRVLVGETCRGAASWRGPAHRAAKGPAVRTHCLLS